MDNINLNDFNNICRTCMNNCDIKFPQDAVITKVLYALTEIHFEINELPQHVCLKCFEKLNEIQEFALKCKQTHWKLLECLNKFKNPGIHVKQEFLEDPLKLDEEITFDDHKIEFIKHEIFNPECENLKSEDVLEDIIIPEISINCSEDVSKTNTFQDSSNNEDSNIEIAETKEKLYKCNVCNKTFSSFKFLERHQSLNNCARSHEYNQSLKSSSGFYDSERDLRAMHSGERPYTCQVCYKEFAHRCSLNNHMRIHTGERPYKCEQCLKTFSQSTHLRRHMRLHTGERPYKCDQCSKSFSQASTLKVHVRTHTGERPYKCDQCSKTFADSSSLQKHMRTHTGEHHYKCNKCLKTYSRKYLLKRHITKHT